MSIANSLSYKKIKVSLIMIISQTVYCLHDESIVLLPNVSIISGYTYHFEQDYCIFCKMYAARNEDITLR